VHWVGRKVLNSHPASGREITGKQSRFMFLNPLMVPKDKGVRASHRQENKN